MLRKLDLHQKCALKEMVEFFNQNSQIYWLMMIVIYHKKELRTPTRIALIFLAKLSLIIFLKSETELQVANY